MLIWTGSWFSQCQPWVAAGVTGVGVAATVALVWWAQGLSADPWVLALVLLGAASGRVVRDRIRWRRWRRVQAEEGFTDEQVLAGERALRRGQAPASAAEREAALHLAAEYGRELGSAMVERWACGLLGAVLLGAAVLDGPRWLAALALLVLGVGLSQVNRRRLDRRCDELLRQVAVRL